MIIKENAISCEYKKIYSLQNKEIYIPIFQRFYAWKEKELVQLKEDLIKAIDNKNAQFYLLDFIYYEEENKYKIADGQQRLVTLNNLIKAIKDYAFKNSIQIDNIELFDINYDVFSNDKKYKEHILKYPIAPFKKAYLELYQFVEKNANRINDLIYVIKNCIYIFLKKCQNADDAFEIFQQINTGGKPLTKDEVIKTALDQYSKAYGIKFDTNNMKEVKQSIISFYKLKLAVFDKNFDNMEIITFLRDYVTKDRDTFQNFVDSISLLKTIGNNPVKYIVDYINRSTLLDVLNVLAMKKIDINTNHKYLSKVVLPLCMMSIVLSLNGGSPTTFRYLLNDVVKDIKNEQTPETIYSKLINIINNEPTTWNITLEDFTQKLGDINTARGIKKSLLIIDIINHNNSGTINVNTINLEHVYPQNPHYEWAGNGWPSHKEDQKVLIDNIGNYLLLSETVNKSIQNQYITQKVEKYKTIIDNDCMLKTPINTVDFDRFGNEKQNYIKERQKRVAEIIQKEFPLGPVLIKN